MAENLEALRGYVHFMREREGVRQIKLTRAAREGLAKLVGQRGGSASGLTPVEVGTRVPSRPAPSRTAGTAVPTLSPVARSATATTFNERIEVTGATKAEQLAHLNERAQVCQKCPHLVARRH